MPDFHWRVPALVHTLDDGSLFARPLLLPAISCYALEARHLRKMLSRRVPEVMKELPPGDIYRHVLAEMPEVRSVTIEVEPLRDDVLRRNPALLTMQYVVWQHGSDALIAFVPALGIEILADDERQLAELLTPQIKMALSRNRSTRSLRDLASLDRFRELRVRPLGVRARLPTLKQAAHEQMSKAAKERSLLKEIASNLAIQPSRPVYERDTDVQRLAELLTRRNPRSVLLVGRSGTGKTALVQHLARRSTSLGLGHVPIYSTSGSQIVAGMTGFGMVQERCESLVREASKAKALLHLGNLVELIEVGKGGGSSKGVAALLRPHLQRGAFLAIVECTPEQLGVVEREDPQLLETLVQFELHASTPEQTRAILRAVARERSSRVRLLPDALTTLDRLHRRWATYSASPGRQLRFLRNILGDRSRDASAQVSVAEVTAAFSHETGLPLFMLDDAIPLNLDRTREWFADRVIGQDEAVRQVVDLLAAVKTQLARSGKPIASLLFIGPTGVGKTEMAKSLAEFLYQDPGRMVRFDMSEYSHPAAVERLIGGAYSAQGLLTQKVRDQPFTVVLLDEFEKADPQLFDVLLQVLGEGRLTDGAGRVTNFTNSVVIMTSNLGVESYRASAMGFSGDSATGEVAERHFERAVQAFLRPEMFNRLDRIVPFAPLDRATIRSIAQRELQHVAAREGLRFRGINLGFTTVLLDHLTEGGFDLRYGARPLKRAIERQLVAPLAEGLNRYASDLRLDCQLELEAGQLQVTVAAQPAGLLSDPNRSAVDAIELVVMLRRHIQALQTSSTITRLKNEIERIRQEERRREQRFKKRGVPTRYAFTPEQARLLGHEELLQRIDSLAREVVALEDTALNTLYASEPLDPADIRQRWSVHESSFRELLFDLPRIQGRGEMLSIAVFGQSISSVVELLRIYGEICRSHDGAMQWFILKMYREDYDESKGTPTRPFQPPPGPRPVGRLLSRQELEDDVREKVIDIYQAPSPDPFDQLPSDCIGIALQIKGDRSVALLETETGRHEFLRNGGSRDDCFVETVMDRLWKYDPPRNVGRRGSMSELRLRRTYDLPAEECRDELLKRTIPIRARQVSEALQKAAEEYLTVRLWELIEAWS